MDPAAVLLQDAHFGSEFGQCPVEGLQSRDHLLLQGVHERLGLIRLPQGFIVFRSLFLKVFGEVVIGMYVMWNLENSLHNLHYVDLTLDSYDLFKSNEWQFHIINIVRRMADFHFHQAASWEEMEHIHRKWVRDYNSQRHWAHEQRTDGWHKGT